jgi:hypothetical protein
MRLTNVAQMSLPRGTLHSFATRVTERAGRSLPISFDQRRHVGAGPRPGSWMAVAFRLPAGTTLDELAAAWLGVIERHGTLRSAFKRVNVGEDDAGEDGAAENGAGEDGAGELALNEVEIAGGEWIRHPVGENELTRDVLRGVLDAACSPFERPSHRMCVVFPDAPDPHDPRPTAVIGSDHAHVDMWSLLVLVRDLIANLEGRSDADRGAAASFAEHSELLERMPPAPVEVRQRWSDIVAIEGGDMPTFPLPLGDVSAPRREVVEVRDVLSSEEARAFDERAASHGVRMTALALSVLAETTTRMSGTPLRAVFPVHSRNEPRWHDSVGWFITNAVIQIDDTDPAASARAVKDALALGSYPLAPIFAPYGGMPAGPGMFAISWLDTRRLPAVESALGIQYVSAVIETDGVMIWFIVNDDGLHLRCRYPDTAEARTNVGAWLDRVETGLRAVVSTAG